MSTYTERKDRLTIGMFGIMKTSKERMSWVKETEINDKNKIREHPQKTIVKK